MIPDEAVEAALNVFEPSWALVPGDWDEYFKRQARAALEAAAPHLLQHFANRVDWRCNDCEDPIDPEEALKILREEAAK